MLLLFNICSDSMEAEKYLSLYNPAVVGRRLQQQPGRVRAVVLLLELAWQQQQHKEDWVDRPVGRHMSPHPFSRPNERK